MKIKNEQEIDLFVHEQLMEINDLLMDGKSMYIADRAKIAYKAIKETNQMLEKLREKSVDD